MMIQEFLEHSAIRYPDKIAVIHGDLRETYSQLDVRAGNLAGFLHSCGIRQGERVALLMENSIEYIIAYYGILKAGAVAAPLNPQVKPDGLQFLLDDLEPAAIITTVKSERLMKAVTLNRSQVKALIIKNPKQKWNAPANVFTFEESTEGQGRATNLSESDAGRLGSIIYTSGSTGRPKGVMLSHANVVSNTLSICKYLSLGPDDIQMVVLPFFYVFGKSLLNTHFAVGGSLVLNNTFSYPATVVKQMINENVTGLSGVPSTYAYLLHRSPLAKSRHDLKSLRYCSQAGGHMTSQLKTDLRQALPEHTRIYIMYGATEASARLTYLDPGQFHQKMGSIGKAIPEVHLKIIDETGRPVKRGEPGQLLAKGPNIMQGYWKDPESTRRSVDENGYYHTGDIAREDDEGYLYLSGRLDHLIKVNGHRVNPREIEDCLMNSRQLIETAVLGIEDPLKGHRLVALCVPLDTTLTEKELLHYCARALPPHQVPGEFIFFKSLPKNGSGKVDKHECLISYGFSI